MHPQHLHDHIIGPALDTMQSQFNTAAARMLLMATTAQESHCGKYVRPTGDGPAYGIYQMKQIIHDRLWRNVLETSTHLKMTVQRVMIKGYPAYPQHTFEMSQMCSNLAYQTVIARLQYFRFPEALPEFNDFEGMWQYYRKYWNPAFCMATRKEFARNWNIMVRVVDFGDGHPKFLDAVSSEA